jgi:hypothetical protein
MGRLLDEIFTDPEVAELLRRVDLARRSFDSDHAGEMSRG